MIQTIVFADISASTAMYDALGNSVARGAMDECLSLMRQATNRCSGRVIKVIGDEILAVFPEVLTAASAAKEMQEAVSRLPLIGNFRRSLHIGLHSGPVIFEGDDVFGDPVNVAARITKIAKAGQILCSQAAADELSDLSASFHLHPTTSGFLKGKVEQLALYELVWQDAAELTNVFQQVMPLSEASEQWIRLVNGSRHLVLGPSRPAALLGRDASASFQIRDNLASRSHCWIEMRGDQFVLVDQSSNGTYVQRESGAEFMVKGQEVRLGRYGRLSFGHPADMQNADSFISYTVSLTPPPDAD